jgi:hypothetical protein
LSGLLTRLPRILALVFLHIVCHVILLDVHRASKCDC